MKRKFSTGLLSVILALLTVLSVPVTTIAAGTYEDTGAERLAAESLTSVTESADINYEEVAETASEREYSPCKSERCKALAEKAREEKELEESIIEVNAEDLSENNGIDDNALNEVNSVTFSNNGASSGYLEGDALFEANVNKLLDGIVGNNSLNEEQKALLIHDRLAEHCEYDDDYEDIAYTGFGAIVYGKAVCEGYAEAYAYLLGLVGIEAYVVRSYDLNHGWNLIKIDGKYYHADVTNAFSRHEFFLWSEEKFLDFYYGTTWYEINIVTSPYSNGDTTDYTFDSLTPKGNKYDDYNWGKKYLPIGNTVYYIDYGYNLRNYDGTLVCYLGSSKIATDGTDLYFVKDKSVFKYNFQSSKIEEIVNFSNHSGNVSDFYYANGKLYLEMKDDEKEYTITYNFNDIIVLNTIYYYFSTETTTSYCYFAKEAVEEGESIKLPSKSCPFEINFLNFSYYTQNAHLYKDFRYSIDCIGWTTEKGDSTVEYACGSSFAPTDDAVLYGVWAETATVKVPDMVPDSEANSDRGVFLGWTTEYYGDTPNVYPGDTITISKEDYTDGDITLYAVWANADSDIYTVTYNPKGGSVSPSKADVVEGYTTKLPTPTKTAQITYNANGGTNAPSAQNTSLTCNGWSTSSSATTAQYSCGSTYKPTNDITLYAVWQKASLTLSSSVPTRNGYKFLGWSSDKYATTADFAAGSKVLIKGDATLYAVWKKIVYTINYYANGGTVNPSKEDVDVGASTKLPTPTKSVKITFDANGGTRTPDVQNCYLNCAGWATNSSFTTGEYACGSTYKPTGHVTLYAVWQKTTVNLISDKPMKEGYKFLGWSRDANATTATYKAGGKINVSGNVTLYAVWGEYEEGDKVIEAVQTNDIALNYKSTAVISVEVTGTDNYTVEYESSNPRVVTVDENGNIITTGTGEAEITVTVTDEFGNVEEDTCKVTVSYAWWQWIILIVLFGWIWY